MATFTVTVPDTVLLGRGGSIGTLAVDWSHVPQQVKDHVASVYFPQYLTDAANAAEVMTARQEEIVEWLVHESGGTVAKSTIEWDVTRSAFLNAAHYPYQMGGQILPSDVPGKQYQVYRRPVGVVTMPLRVSAEAARAGNRRASEITRRSMVY